MLVLAFDLLLTLDCIIKRSSSHVKVTTLLQYNLSHKTLVSLSASGGFTLTDSIRTVLPCDATIYDVYIILHIMFFI